MENQKNNNVVKNYKISVVIPCYNQEKYIESCLTSLVKQKFEDLEVIIVDDGSTDLTKQKIEEFKAKNDKLDIFYYYQDNAGPGVARNTALDNAHGKYIAFLDSDDKIPAGAYNALYYTAEKNQSDVVIGEYFRRIDNNPWYVYDYIQSYCENNEGKNCVGDYVVAIKSPSLWNRLFRRNFLNDNNIRFLPEMHGEDVIFNLDAVRYAQRIFTTKSLVYCYSKKTADKNSISTSWNLRNTSSHIRAIKTYSTFFDKNNEVYAELVFLNTNFEYFLHGLNTIKDEHLQEELFKQFKEILILYKDNIRYEKFIELILGVSIDLALSIPYKVYKSIIYKMNEKNKCISSTVKNVFTEDCKNQTLNEFRNGKIGFRYIILYFKAWFKNKLKRMK